MTRYVEALGREVHLRPGTTCNIGLTVA